MGESPEEQFTITVRTEEHLFQFLVIPEQEGFNILYEQKHFAEVEVNFDYTWRQLDGDHDRAIIDRIGLEIEKHYKIKSAGS